MFILSAQKSDLCLNVQVEMSTKTLGLAAAGAGLLGFVGYCIYFDKKRRNDPDYKQKLKEKRSKAKQAKSQSKTQLPDLNNQEAMQKFFLQQVQQGEELLSTGDIEGGVEHLSNAVAVCGQPQQLLQVLQQTLPPQVFQLLIQKLPSVGQRLMSSAAAAAGGEGPIIEEEELE